MQSENRYQRIWASIVRVLDRSLPNWRQRIEAFGQVAAAERRSRNESWSDDEVLRALLLSVLSSNTDWSTVEKILPELPARFDNYDISILARTTDQLIESEIVPWFKQRRACSQSLSNGLKNLVKACLILQAWSDREGSAESYFLRLLRVANGDPKQAVILLGTDPTWKLPGLGVPLAAEALRNMGFDVCKPDRHICRALGSFQMVSFRNWNEDRKLPSPNKIEYLETMEVIERMSSIVHERATFIDNAIWLLCARSGTGYTNEQLKRLSDG